jgi:hypothetical protein
VALAHPLTEPFQLPVSPLVTAWVATALVLIVSFAWPRASGRSVPKAEPEAAAWAGSLSLRWTTRLVGAALLILAVLAGRLGDNDELDNIAPALIVGSGWPLLVLASVLAGPVWRWVDPWDTLARALARGQSDEASRDVRPAALVALAWVWYLSAYTDTLEPRSVGTMLALYTVFTVGGCLAFGRRRWLSSAEPLGIVLGWMALFPRGRLADWDPPRGAEALLGVLAGGVLFGAVRRSELWGDLNTADGALLLATLGVLVSAAAAAGLIAGTAAIARLEQPDTRSAAARAAVPAVAGIIVAVAMDQNRLTTSIQLLPGLLGDPFGLGWDLFGRSTEGLDPAPFGTRGLLIAQLTVLLAGYLAGAAILARRARRGARVPVALGLAILANLSVIALASH